MAKIKITKAEISKMLADQLDVKEVIWDDDGNAEVELDLDKIKKQEQPVTISPISYPIYIERSVRYPYYWTVSTDTKTNTYPTITYCSNKTITTKK